MPHSLDDLLSPYAPELRALSLAARDLILSVIPDATEQVDVPSKLIVYGFGTRMSDTICTIMPQRSWVNLGFYRGVELPDPAGLLEGTGKLHRHVKLRTTADLESPALMALLEAAVAAKRR